MGVAHTYPFEMPVTLVALGYSTTSIGKDHFGWVDGPDGGANRAIPDCHFAVQLNHFIPGFRSYSVAGSLE